MHPEVLVEHEKLTLCSFVYIYMYIWWKFWLFFLRKANCHGSVGAWCRISYIRNPKGKGIQIIEGSLEVKLPTIWRDEKAVSREKSQKRKDQKKEDAGARKGRKVAKHCVFSWFCGSGGLKSRLAKAAGAETSGEMRDEKLHAVVALSWFRSEKVQNTSAPDHFWKLRCWKSARRCGAKHIWK